MRWTERQQALLAEMGIRLWVPPGAAEASARSAPAAGASMAPMPVASPSQVTAAVPGAADVPLAGTPPLARREPARAGVPAESAKAAEAADRAPGWPGLRDAVMACTACRLCESRRQPVFGSGPESAAWMVVGESPGEPEDELGEPFVGKPGQLLDNMLRAVGLARGAAGGGGGGVGGVGGGAAGGEGGGVYLTNAVKCRAPGSRVPRLDELERCEHFLIRQVQLVQPKVILAMGTVAVQSLLRSTEPIGRLRGRVHRFEGVPLVVTYHPAYLLRNLQDKARAWDDLCLAAEAAAASVG